MGNIPNFGDLVSSRPLDGDKKKLDDILDKPIIVTGVQIRDSKYSKNGTEHCTMMQFYFENDPEETRYVFFTGSGVICEQAQEITSKLEADGLEILFRTTIKKCGKYHALT